MKQKIVIVIAVIVGILIGGISVKYIGGKGGHDKKEHAEEKHEDGENGKAVKLDEDDMKEFGIEVGEAAPGRISVIRELPGEIVPNADKLVQIAPRITGMVAAVHKNLGDSVKAGEVLAVIESKEFADTKAMYLAALKRAEISKTKMQREEILWQKQISPELDYLDAKRALDESHIELNSAKQKLHALGVTDAELAKLPSQSGMGYSKYALRAPFSGTVIEKNITRGAFLKEDAAAFVIADLSTVWVNISIYQKDMPYVKTGQAVTIATGQQVLENKAKIIYVSSTSGEQTRTAMARIVLPNKDGQLRPGLFVTAKLVIDEAEAPILIPKTAVVTEGEKTEIFIESKEGFRLQPVTLGRTDDAYAEVTGGLDLKQRYVAKGAFTLKAQISKGAFGDGHAH
jgi:cobalt-zinc-cadmium efflux system membrane fusion protein